MKFCLLYTVTMLLLGENENRQRDTCSGIQQIRAKINTVESITGECSTSKSFWNEKWNILQCRDGELSAADVPDFSNQELCQYYQQRYCSPVHKALSENTLSTTLSTDLKRMKYELGGCNHDGKTCAALDPAAQPYHPEM